MRSTSPLLISALLGAASSLGAISARAFTTSTSSRADNLVQDKKQGVVEDASDMTSAEKMEASDQEIFRAVMANGIAKSPLPPQYEQVRQKYNMAGPEYDHYWRLAATSRITGKKFYPSANGNAKRKLAAIEKVRTAQGLPVPRKDDRITTHKALMREARKIAQKKRMSIAKHISGINTEDHDELRNEGLQAQLATQNAGDQARLVAKIRDLEQNLKSGERLLRDERIKNENNPKGKSEREIWRERKKLAAAERKQNDLLVGLQNELTGSRKQLAAKQNEVIEEMKEKEELIQRQAVLLEKRDELVQKLREEQASSPSDAMSRRELLEAQREAHYKKMNSVDLSDILDVATDKAKEEGTIIDTNPLSFEEEHSNDTTPHAQASMIPARVAYNPPVFNILQPQAEVSIRPEQFKPSTRFVLPPVYYDTIPIDADFTISLHAETPQLQTQISTMQQRLKSSYPRIDTLPYNVWESENRKTLQTWLKILATRWRTRFDNVPGEEGSGLDLDVKSLLDQMVRDHDLTNDAAKRMASRWIEVMSSRGDMAGDDEGTLDWDEFDAGGMGFLRAEEVGGEKASEKESGKMAGRGEMKEEIKTVRPVSSLDKTIFKPIMPGDSYYSRRRSSHPRRLYSTSSQPPPPPINPTLPAQPSPSPFPSPSTPPPPPSLPHLTPTGSAHMVSISTKPATTRTATALGSVHFSNPTPLSLIKANALKKGDVLSVSRIAGILCAKKCPEIVPLCHPIMLTHVGVEVRVIEPKSKAGAEVANRGVGDGNGDVGGGGGGGGGDRDTARTFGAIEIQATVQCTGPTGVEMEALTAVMGAALSVVDMCKAVDRGMEIGGVRVVRKEGGRSGGWREEGWKGGMGEG